MTELAVIKTWPYEQLISAFTQREQQMEKLEATVQRLEAENGRLTKLIHGEVEQCPTPPRTTKDT